MQAEVIVEHACKLGENPLWHATEKAVYWCDITVGRIFRYLPSTRKHEQVYQGEVVGGFTIQEDGNLLLFMVRGSVKILRDGKLVTVIDEIEDERESRFNDVIADPEGRVFCGTMPTDKRPGRLYRLDPPSKLALVLEGIRCSNGLGFTPDLKQLYYTDSLANAIYLFDYDRKQGAISNRRVFVQVPEEEGLPDGLTVDSLGYVWSAQWDGSSIVRYTPEGKVDRRIAVPAKKASSLTFGGGDLTDIYITTAGGDARDVEGAAAGSLFGLRQDVRGTPEFVSRIALPAR
jgi:D-xylono/L-arabinono-1,4-lactonase